MEGIDFKNPIISLANLDPEEVKYRLFFSQLIPKETEILDELLHSPLNISLAKFCVAFDQLPQQLLPFLEKLENVGFLQIKNGVLSIDKNKRKVFERHIIKFNNDFRPDVEYLKILLKIVPFEQLVQWYHVPQTSSDIFISIVEGYLKTPKTYSSYLQQFSFPDPIPGQILKDLLESESLELSASSVRQQYGLSEENFAEIMLLLEFNLLCFSSFRPTKNEWEEIIVPLHEWQQYVQFFREKSPQPVQMKIDRFHAHDFGFVQDLTQLVQLIAKKPIPFESDLQSEQLLEFSQLSPSYKKQLLKRLLSLNLAEMKEGRLFITPLAAKWLQKSVVEQASLLTRYSLSQVSTEIGTEWQKVERDLKRVSSLGWVFFDDFFSGLTVNLRGVEPVSLSNRGKRWGYQLPKYSREDELRVRQAFLSYLFEGGVVALGHSEDRLCFHLTPFGHSRLNNTSICT